MNRLTPSLPPVAITLPTLPREVIERVFGFLLPRPEDARAHGTDAQAATRRTCGQLSVDRHFAQAYLGLSTTLNWSLNLRQILQGLPAIPRNQDGDRDTPAIARAFMPLCEPPAPLTLNGRPIERSMLGTPAHRLQRLLLAALHSKPGLAAIFDLYESLNERHPAAASPLDLERLPIHMILLAEWGIDHRLNDLACELIPEVALRLLHPLDDDGLPITGQWNRPLDVVAQTLCDAACYYLDDSSNDAREVLDRLLTDLNGLAAHDPACESLAVVQTMQKLWRACLCVAGYASIAPAFDAHELNRLYRLLAPHAADGQRHWTSTAVHALTLLSRTPVLNLKQGDAEVQTRLNRRVLIDATVDLLTHLCALNATSEAFAVGGVLRALEPGLLAQALPGLSAADQQKIARTPMYPD